VARRVGKCWRAGCASSRRDGALQARPPRFARLPHEACLGSSGYCRTVCGCGVRLGAGPARCTTPLSAARRCSCRGCSTGYSPCSCAAGAPGATRSEQARFAVERSRSQSIEPPGAEPHLRRKSARLRTVGGSGAYLCAATPMVPAAGAVSLAVPADAVVSATDVVPTTRVVAASPPPSADRRYSASFGRPRQSPIKGAGSTRRTRGRSMRATREGSR
jgi:hypothetical protein